MLTWNNRFFAKWLFSRENHQTNRRFLSAIPSIFSNVANLRPIVPANTGFIKVKGQVRGIASPLFMVYICCLRNQPKTAPKTIFIFTLL